MILVRCQNADREALQRVSIDPAEIADDGTDYEGVRVKKPWGHEIERYRDESVAVWWLHLHMNQETSMHCHPNKTTLLMIVSGRAIVSTLDQEHEIGEGAVVVIEKGAFHRTRATNGNGVMLYELESPPNKRDLVRLHDVYGRGQGYEHVERV